mmetsp:Transcript_38134/g.108871  ORF Transcript_38134/g.108871 Transcript_38134/m.108871 type:complete len:255 (-) Transcript_38134:747-1511(-)
MYHESEGDVHVGLVVEIRLRIGISQRGREALGARQSRTSECESRHSGQIVDELEACLVPGALVARIGVGRGGLWVSGQQRGQRQPPGGLLAVDEGTVLLAGLVTECGAVLRRDVHDVGVVIALGRLVARPLVKCVKPSVDVAPATTPADLQTLPVERRGAHSFDMAHILQVHNRRHLPLQKPRPLRLAQLTVHLIQTRLERPPGHTEGVWSKDEGAPLSKQLSLERQQVVGAVHGWRALGREGGGVVGRLEGLL